MGENSKGGLSKGGLSTGGSPRGPGDASRGSAPLRPTTDRGIGERVDFHISKAHEYVLAERHAEAFEELSKAARLDPGDSRPQMGLGEVYRKLDYDELALEAFRRAVAIEPTSGAAKVSLAVVLCDFGKHREALDLLKEVEKQDPSDPFVWAELAVNSLRLGRPKEAIPLLRRYNEAKGKQAWGLENLGRAYADAGEDEQAEAAYREAIRIQPKTALAHLWLGQLLITKGRRSEAEALLSTYHQIRELQTQTRLLEQSINRSPDDVASLARLAQVRALLGLEKKALVPLERALRIAPDDARLQRFYQELKAKADAEAQERPAEGPAR